MKRGKYIRPQAPGKKQRIRKNIAISLGVLVLLIAIGSMKDPFPSKRDIEDDIQYYREATEERIEAIPEIPLTIEKLLAQAQNAEPSITMVESEPSMPIEETKPPIVKEKGKSTLEAGKWGYVFGSKYSESQIASITFLDNTTQANGKSWDVSEAKDGSILAWVTPAPESEGLFDLFIGSENEIYGTDGLSFRDYKNVDQITFNGLLNTSEITDFSEMFANFGCNSEIPVDLDLTSWDVSNGENMSRMFWNCQSLRYINLTGWDVSNVESMYGMFASCSALASIDFPTWDISNVQDASYMFMDSENIDYLDIDSWDKSLEMNADWMFYNCKSLENKEELNKLFGSSDVPPANKRARGEALSDLSVNDLGAVLDKVYSRYSNFKWPSEFEGDIGEYDLAYSQLDIDHDGKKDSIYRVIIEDYGVYGFEVRFGNGSVLSLDTTENLLGGNMGVFAFVDLNNSGKDDILAISSAWSQGAGGVHLKPVLYMDTLATGGKYRAFDLPQHKFSMENIGNRYVRISNTKNNYSEIFPLAANPMYEYDSAEGFGYEYYFGSSSEVINECRMQDIVVKGSQLIVLYNFHGQMHGASSDNLVAVEITVKPSGEMTTGKIGSSVIRKWWLD